MSSEVADAEAANLWSAAIPALNPAERGAGVLQATLERTPIISPSFAAAPFKLVKDATSGLVKLGLSTKVSPAARWQSLAGREQLAVLRLTTMTGSLAAISVGSYIASGYSPDEAVKTTFGSSGRFLSIAFGKDFYVPIGGPFRSFARAVYPKKVAGSPVPLPFVGLPQFARGKVTPVISRGLDLARNRDFFGRKIMSGGFPENILRGVWYAAEGVLPLTAGGVSEIGRLRPEQFTTPEGLKEIGREVAGRFAGTDIRGPSEWQQFKSAWQEKYGYEYGTKPADKKRALADPDLAQQYESAIESFGPPDDPRSEYSAESQAILDNYKARLDALGRDAAQGAYGEFDSDDPHESQDTQSARRSFWEAYSRAKDIQIGEREDLDKKYPQVVAGYRKEKPESAEDAAVGKYFAVQDRHPHRNTDEQWVAYESDLARSLSPQELQMAERELAVGDLPLEQRWHELNAMLDPYYEIPEDHEDERRDWRAHNPEADAAMWVLGRVSKLRSHEAVGIGERWLQELVR